LQPKAITRAAIYGCVVGVLKEFMSDTESELPRQVRLRVLSMTEKGFIDERTMELIAEMFVKWKQLKGYAIATTPIDAMIDKAVEKDVMEEFCKWFVEDILSRLMPNIRKCEYCPNPATHKSHDGCYFCEEHKFSCDQKV